MRPLICLVGLLIASSALAVDVPARQGGKSPQIAVHLSVANPCLNSRYAEHATCNGKVTRNVVEKMQNVQMRSTTGEVLSNLAADPYMVRTIDFY